jgi:hypothetical protein
MKGKAKMAAGREIGLALAALLAVAGAGPVLAQQAIQASGTYHHRHAAAAFPVQVGEFQRSDLFQYDADGRDVSGSYNLPTPEGRILITAYIYPAAPAAGEAQRMRSCRDEYEAAAGAIEQNRPDAVRESEGGSVAAGQVPAALRHRGIYRFGTEFDGRVQPIRSEVHLYCYVGGGWLVKYRVSAPEAVDTSRAVEAFIRAGPWPGRDGETVAAPGRPRTAG